MNQAARYLVLCCGFLATLANAADSDFANVIHPVLEQCVTCHGGAHPQSGLSLETREGMLKGGASGPAIVPGSAKDSLLVKHITGELEPRMPMNGPALSAQQIAVITAWVDDKAPWPDMGAKPAAEWQPPLAPRNPPVPPGPEANPIDRFLGVYFQGQHATPAPAVSDAAFARRAYYDIIGLPPSAAELRRFLADSDAGKRRRLIETLLDDSPAYAENWISFWNDLLRNDQGVNYAGTRESITEWLRPALQTNMPYSQMVSELVNPKPKAGPEGFLLGVNWRGSVNASQTPFMQAAQNTAQVFLGINLKCASCHDSFINRYRLKQSYGLAAMFSETSSLELVRCDAKTGKFTGPEFLYPELGAVPNTATLAERRAAAARLFTSPQNGRLARTMVNRYWQKLIGRGLVEPVDEMDNRPWNEDLLDWLASDFAAHGYDLKHLLLQIMTSQAYQMPAVAGAPDRTKTYTFRGPQVRRLTAEQFADTVSALTGEWRILQSTEKGKAEAVYSREWQLKSTALTRAMGRPIRDQVFTTRNEDATTLQALELMNGETLERVLRRGARRLLNELPPPPPNRFDSGVMRKKTKPFDIDISGVKQLWFLTEDGGSYDPAQTVSGWIGVELTGPKGAVKLADLPGVAKFTTKNLTIDKAEVPAVMTVPVSSTLTYNIDGMGFTRLRGSVGVDDSGDRSDIEAAVRFFVFSEAPDRDELVRVSGKPPVAPPDPAKDAGRLIDRLFLEAFARQPSPAEREIANQFLLPEGSGGKIQNTGLEDLLWSLLMHPELQYIN